jgi:hypothetical protein
MAKRSSRHSLPKGFDAANKRWNEPLVSLICFNLAQGEAAYERLRQMIDARWQGDLKLEARDIRRMIEEPIQHRAPQKTDFMVDLIADLGVYLIDALPEQTEGKDVKRFTMALYNALIGETVAFGTNTDPLERRLASLNDLFSVRASQISEQQEVAGEYFGYRRSTTRGTIIRFSISIQHLGKGLYAFENHFRSRQDDWIVNGTGFFKEGNLYLVGNAASKSGVVGRGLRCFALRPDPGREGVISGLVLTTEASKRPIAARVLLIPVQYHHDLKNPSADLDLRQILLNEDVKGFWITDDVNSNELDRVIDIPHLDSPSILINKGIRNGTVSTVRFDGCEGESDEAAAPDEEALLELLYETNGNPTILYLRAIQGAEGRLKQGRS